MLHEMFDGNQTWFNIIQHNATSCNMAAKRVQHVAFNNVECNMLNRGVAFVWPGLRKLQCNSWLISVENKALVMNSRKDF